MKSLDQFFAADILERKAVRNGEIWKMKFVMSYSCGKDSTLALYKLIEAGNEPVGLLVMVNEELDRSWFHGADYKLFGQVFKSLGHSLDIVSIKGRGISHSL